MVNYITRKKTLQGVRFETEVKLKQYGDAVVRIHALPDLAIARIEDKTGYTLEDAMSALSSQNLTEEEIKALKDNTASPELIAKASQALSPKLTLFLGELAKAGIIPNPGCACKGAGCDDCDVAQMVEELRSFSVLEIGMAVIGASTAAWGDVQAFFSLKKGPSGQESPA